MKRKFFNKKFEKKEEKPIHINTSNTPFLIIVESPSKCLKIEKLLGFQYKCIASKGHLREIKKVMPAKQKYDIVFEPISEKIAHIEYMLQIVKQFDPKNIFLGTDDDREGEAIAWHICDVCKLHVNTTKRILFHEITASALKYAVSHHTTIRMNIVNAQKARQILDRMIGFQISPILSRILVHDNSKFLSAGRCQTPTLRLIYDRYKSAQNKSEKVQYKIQGDFFSHPSILHSTLANFMENEKEVKTFLEDSKSFDHIFDLGEQKSKSNISPKPFNTSHLLQTSSSVLHISPKHTMDLCQKLYQDGKITYMRTESCCFAQDFIHLAKTYVEEKFGESYLGNLEKITNFDNQNPHEAIRCTHLGISKTDYSDKKMNDLYRLIWKRTIESCMAPYTYYEYEAKITAPISYYKSDLVVPLFLGWKRLSTTLEEMNEEQQKKSMEIEFFKKYLGKKVSYQKIQASLFMKDLEQYYQEASIIQKLESLGIGRPSTYSMLVDTIQERKYVLKQDIEGEEFRGNEYILNEKELSIKEVHKIFGASKNKLKIQDLGIQAIDILFEHFAPIFDYSYTSKMEEELDTFITNPNKKIEDVCGDCENMLKVCLKPLKDKMKKSYVIDDFHELIFGKSGMMIRVISSEGSDEIKYKSLKPNLELDFQKLENGEYKLEDLLELSNDCLGIFENESMYLKNGPYGPYVIWGNSKLSIASYVKNIPLSNISLDMVITFIDKHKQKESKSKILREINHNTSVRKGDYGNYILFKTDKMKKPIFINLKKCPHDPLEDSIDIINEWVQETLNK
uniref:DNA topoisomerase n=1 Tax=viral metagenome TaxID=1070528 RepID=A0A6C0CPN7_9ZZZZ